MNLIYIKSGRIIFHFLYFCRNTCFDMSLETEIMAQLKQAMKDKNEVALRTLRAIKSAIIIEKTAGPNKDVLTAEEEIKIIKKLAKQRKDSIDIFTTQSRLDLAQKEEEELAILNTFLPQQLSKEALVSKIKLIIERLGVTDAKEMGKVIGAANKELQGQAEGKDIADTVKSLLN